MQAIYRLKKNIHFKYVYRTGQSIACKNLIMIYTENNTGRLKVGFSVSKKIGKSVVRNKVKRRMREAFRHVIPLISPKYNYVIIARDVVVDDDYQKISQSLSYMLKKSGLFLNQDGVVPQTNPQYEHRKRQNYNSKNNNKGTSI